MNHRKKLIQELTIRNSFMFAAVMSEERNCKPFLEMTLGIKIERIEVSYEKSFTHNPGYKGIRLDVYASDENNTRYDVELQVGSQELGRRVRYYHSEMDRDLIRSGHAYEELARAYVIFICDFDPFKLKKYCYTFENRCLEDFNLSIGDGSRSIILSTRGENPEDISEELRAFLQFIREDTPGTDTIPANQFVKQLQETIRHVKQDGEMERRYMTIWELQKDAESKGELRARRNAILELLEDYGDLSESLHGRIISEEDPVKLKAMHKAAAKAGSLEEFTNRITNL